MFSRLTLTLCVFILSRAANANEDWIKPASTFVDTMNSGLVQLGAGVVGAGIVLWGLYTAISGEGNWKSLSIRFVGGAAIFFGPEIAIALYEAAQGS